MPAWWTSFRYGRSRFLRATYWRWAEGILEVCPDLADAPSLLAIGDTHLENYGTWRDADGRLAWGINDFDEAAPMPYPLDLVRLATSALLGRGAGGPSSAVICRTILSGYRQGMDQPQPFILERDHREIRETVLLPEGERRKFWRKFAQATPDEAPPAYLAALQRAMPAPGLEFTIARRVAGTGSLGRPRFVASASWNGGPILREAKALVSSAWSLHHRPTDTKIRAAALAASRFRAPDPHYRLRERLLVRRLSPNSRKIEVSKTPLDLLEPGMLEAMGYEIANCHSSAPGPADAARQDLARRGARWLQPAAKAAARWMREEYEAFR